MLPKQQVNPALIAQALLERAVELGWVVREGQGTEARYFVTHNGWLELASFGVKVVQLISPRPPAEPLRRPGDIEGEAVA